MTLTEFTTEVNKLSQDECNLSNSIGSHTKLVRHDFPEPVLKWYYEEGMTPFATLSKLTSTEGADE